MKFIRYFTMLTFSLCLFSMVVFANAAFKCGPGTVIDDSKWLNVFMNFYFSAPTYHSAITSGTSGCDGFSYNDELRVKYIAGSYENLKEEAAIGSGDHLNALALLMGCPNSQNLEFSRATRMNYPHLFGIEDKSEEELLAALKTQVSRHEALSRECDLQS